jgi:hypothetical protein
MNVGDRVKIGRDETTHPSKGSWPQFRGKDGTIVETNLGEYGVSFGKVTTAAPNHKRRFNWESSDVSWFRRTNWPL